MDEEPRIGTAPLRILRLDTGDAILQTAVGGRRILNIGDRNQRTGKWFTLHLDDGTILEVNPDQVRYVEWGHI